MRLRRYSCLVLLAATAVLAFSATGANAGSTAAAKPQAATASKGKVGVKYTIKKFVRHGNRLVAYGAATPRYISTSGAVTKGRATAFKAAVTVRTRHLAAQPGSTTVCPVLDLVLGPLDLNLLGAMVHLDQVHVTITADPNGGLLGNLLCNLSKQGKLAAQTQKMNWALTKSGLSAGGAGVVVNVAGDGATPNAVTATGICDVLDLTLGPIHLDLLGLVVDTNTIHLTITADPNGGILGSLLCSLAGGAPAPAPTP